MVRFACVQILAILVTCSLTYVGAQAQPVAGTLQRVDIDQQSVGAFLLAVACGGGISDNPSESDPTVIAIAPSISDGSGDCYAAAYADLLGAVVNVGPNQVTNQASVNALGNFGALVRSRNSWNYTDTGYDANGKASFLVDNPAQAQGAGTLQCSISIDASLATTHPLQSGSVCAGEVRIKNLQPGVTNPNLGGPSYIAFFYDSSDNTWSYDGWIGFGGRRVEIPLTTVSGDLSISFNFTMPTFDGDNVDINSNFSGGIILSGQVDIVTGEIVTRSSEFDITTTATVSPSFSIQ